MRIMLLFIILAPLVSKTQQRHDVLITEIMADFSPAVSLPANEWLELLNISNSPINLQSWRIADASNTSGPLPLFILEPGHRVILCANSAVAAMNQFGVSLGLTNFPSLDNDGDQVTLLAPSGQVIHAVRYSAAWYKNDLKKEGGWTLEMIDPQNPCTGAGNWQASIALAGGTPGIANSVQAINTDTLPPLLQRTYTSNDRSIALLFDEPVDSLQASALTNYAITHGLHILQAVAQPPLFEVVQLQLSSPLQPQTVYEVSVSLLTDCKGNTMTGIQKAKAGLPGKATAGDIAINEILFNPRPAGEDYIECYNSGNKIIDAASLHIATRDNNNTITQLRALSNSPRLIFPGEYIVATPSAESLEREYLVINRQAVLTPGSLPSMPDDKGITVLLNNQGDVIDELAYNHSWHFKLLQNEEGVSLERIDPLYSTQQPANWHSASSTAGYGTPGYKNSQYRSPVTATTAITISPAIISPDNDGRDDFATIQYSMDEPGYVANCNVFDVAGRPVRAVSRNLLLGREGQWTWDGLGDRGQELRAGIYIILTELFTLQGKTLRYKNVIVLAVK